MGDIILINGKSIEKGETAEINLQFASLPTHTMIDLPIFVYRALKDGPTLLITAGLHGDEINGIEVIRKMIFDKTIIPTAGTVIAIPVVNVYGFIQTSREFPDGKDLNRSFPGSKSGSLASRIAHVMMNEILPNIDFGVDFHTGGASKANFPHIRCNTNDREVLKLAKAFSPPLIVNSKPPDHSFRKSAYLKGKTILTFEGGESLRFDEKAIKHGLRGVRRLMNYLGMSETKIASQKTLIMKRSWWNRAQTSGLFRPKVKPGQEIARYQVLGHITDPYGETEFTIKSRAKGVVIGLNNLCVVNKGEALIHIAAENS